MYPVGYAKPNDDRFTDRVVTPIADRITEHSSQDGSYGTDERKSERFVGRPNTEGDEEDIGRDGEERGLGQGNGEKGPSTPWTVSPRDRPVVEASDHMRSRCQGRRRLCGQGRFR